MASKAFYDKMQAIDRRWVFLMIGLAVIIPLLFEFAFSEVATPEVRAVFDRIEGLEEATASLGRRPRVLVSFDFDPPSEPEILPMAIGMVRHLALANCRIYTMALWPIGQQEAETVLNSYLQEEFPDLVYGEDFLTLGYQVGGAGLINVMVNDFRKLYATDTRGNAIDSIPMMEGIYSLSDIDLILNLSAGAPGLKEWVQFAGDRVGVPIAGGVTAVQAPLMYPYYPRQMFGILGGLKAAAEYEQLLIESYGPDSSNPRLASGIRHLGIERMGPQTFAHLVIILFIVLGNFAFFMSRRKGTTGLSE